MKKLTHLIRTILIISILLINILLINIIVIRASFNNINNNIPNNNNISNNNNIPNNDTPNNDINGNIAISNAVSNAVSKAVYISNNPIIGNNNNNNFNNPDLNDVKLGDIEWIDPQENTLSLLEHFTRDNFLVEATDFYNHDNDSTVLITTYDMSDNNIVSRVIARAGDSYNISNEANTSFMNITIKDLKMIKGNISADEGLNVVSDERVKIQTKLAGIPDPKLSILPKGREVENRTFIDRDFSQGSEISINFSIQNEGKSALRHMHLIINRDKNNDKNLPFFFYDESVNRELPELKANETNVVNIRFRAPNVNKSTRYDISGTITGKDAFGRIYSTTDSTFITVKYIYDNVIELQKYIPEKIYMGDYANIVLYVQNNGYSNITYLKLHENIPIGFEKLNDFNYDNYTFMLGPLERKIISYRLKPAKPGIYNFPAKGSVIEWEGGSVYNNKSNVIIINGPYIELKKYGSIEGNNIRINILAKNSGDSTGIVRLVDPIPKDPPNPNSKDPYSAYKNIDNENVTNIIDSLVVRSNSVSTFSYTISMDRIKNLISEGKIFFPHTDAIILDQYLYSNDRYAQKAMSNDLILNVNK